MTGEDNKRQENRGFAGLSSLISDVEIPSPPPPASPQPQPQQAYQEEESEPVLPPSSGWSGSKWPVGVVIIVAFIAVFWLFNQSGSSSIITSPVSTTATRHSESFTASRHSEPFTPTATTPRPARPTESKPPVGKDLVLSIDQIHYCLAEDIRMDAAKSALNRYNDYDVDRFNTMVTDYNSRCGNFRYRSGALDWAQHNIEPYRDRYRAEGQSRFAHSFSASNPSTSYEPPEQATTLADVLTEHIYTPSMPSPNPYLTAASGGQSDTTSPKFTDYAVDVYSGAHTKVKLISDFDKNYKTRLRRTQSQAINFAGEYILTLWGCGATCVTGAAVNTRTGHVVPLPGTVCCWKGEGDSVIFKKNSRLIVLAGLINEKGQYGAHFYELKNGYFLHVKTRPVKEDDADSMLQKTEGTRTDNAGQKTAESLLLDSLRLPPGGSGRMMDSGDMIVSLAKAGYVSLKPDTRYGYSDYRLLKKPLFIGQHEAVVIDEEYFDEFIGCCVNPGIAITFKTKGSTRDLEEFARRNRCRITSDNSAFYFYDGPALPAAPQGTYVTLSCKKDDAL